MRSSAHSPIATMLLLIPILAVPMFAIFGIPQFAPVVASPLQEPLERTGDDAPTFQPLAERAAPEFELLPKSGTTPSDLLEWEQDEPTVAEQAAELPQRRTPPQAAAPAAAAELADFAQNLPIDPASLTPEQQAALAARLGAGAAVNPLEYRRDRQPRAASVVPASATRKPSSHPRSAAAVVDPSLTWQGAVQRLNDLEIRNFRLEPGQQLNQFVFICSYTPHDNPRVSYRFEAEAEEPLRAVEKVLSQIDAWLAAR